VTGTSLKDEDYVINMIHTSAHAYLLFFSSLGRVYRLKAHQVPQTSRTARGTAIVNLLPLQPEEKIAAIVDTRDYETNRFLFFVTRNGTVKKTRFNEYDSSRQAGLIAINLRDDDELVEVRPTNGDDDIFLASRDGQVMRFSENDVRAMGRSAGGVRGMKFRGDDHVVGAGIMREDCQLLIVSDRGFGKRTPPDQFATKGRGGLGVRGLKVSDERGHVVNVFMVGDDDDVFLVAASGTIIRMPVADISTQGRDASGVTVMSLESSDRVAAVAPILSVDVGAHPDGEAEGDGPEGLVDGPESDAESSGNGVPDPD
jgi:DNA gyrase subunit A